MVTSRMRPNQVAGSPWALMKALGNAPGAVMLHSASNADGVGAQTFVAAYPWREIVVRGDHAELREGEQLVASQRGMVSQAIDGWLTDVGVSLHGDAQALPWVAGYMGYEFGLQVGAGHKVAHRRASPGATTSELPDVWLGIYTAICQWEGGGEGEGVLLADPQRQLSPSWERALAAAWVADEPAMRGRQSVAPLQARNGDADYVSALQRVLDYIAAGDVYQVNIARQLCAPWPTGDALALYRALCAVSPAPFGGVLHLPNASIITNSPELFLRKQPGNAAIETRPIKGTRRRHDHDDATTAAELLASEKDGAEHDMIVDLERNDLGRVCEIGSVEVIRHGYALTLPHLIHRVSQVQGQLRPDVGWAALLAAMFPGGSITGAPKLRAMQIIAELEPFRRGPYCGAIGYLRRGELALSVAIRTAVLANGEVSVTVGGGIVADSNPDAELAETTTKAMGFAAALRGES